MAAWQGWEAQVLQASRLPVTARNIQLLRGWQASEGGTAAFNPLNTTTHAPGSTSYNSNGGTPVQNFKSRADGIAATVRTLHNGNYGSILAALRQGNADYRTFGQAVDSSPWGTHGGYIRQWSGGVSGKAPVPTNAGMPAITESGQSQQLANVNLHQQLALQMLGRSNALFNAGGKALQGPSLADLVKQRQMAAQMTKLGDQSGIQFQDQTGGALQNNPRVSGVINLAKQYIGTKYVYGASNPNVGFDCSGFVQYVYGLKGKSIPRTTQSQFSALPAVNPNNLQPGDLVYFAGSDGTVQSPGHVQMYIGHGQVISAPHTGDVVHISNLNIGPGSGFSGARRVA